MVSAEDMAILKAYSTGACGWRKACMELRLMDIGELHDLLQAHHMPPPPADDTPPDEEMVRRFTAFLEGKDT